MQEAIENLDGSLTSEQISELKKSRRKIILDISKIQIQHTPYVVIQAVRCNGIVECWKGTDEKNCSLSWRYNLALGELLQLMPLPYSF